MTTAFHQPGSVGEACERIAENPEAKLIAGGQSLLPFLRTGALEPDAFVDISGLDELSYVEADGGTLRIGGGTTWATLHESDVVEEHTPTIGALSGEIGDIQVRNRGTIGGSLGHADPATDMGALLRCYDTELVCRSTDGERAVPIDEFFEGLYETALRDDELLTEVRVDLPDGRFGGHYEKFEHRKGGFSMVGVGATVALADDDRVEELRIGLANCGDIPVAVDAATERAAGEPVDEDLLADVESAVTDAADPVGDANASREYKKRAAGKIAARAVENAAEEAR